MKKLFILSLALVFAGCSENNIGIGGSGGGGGGNSGGNDVPTPEKKGVAFTSTSKDWSHKTSKLQAHWLYSWGYQLKEELPDSVEFVPMFWGKGSVNDDKIAYVKNLADQGKIKYILGFNEPDGQAQSNMTVDEAIALWPRLEEIGVPIGSPATVHPDNDWMVEFMSKADDLGLRVDFITVHHYGGANASSFLTKLQKTHEMYGNRPIWVTEFAVADWQAATIEDNKYTPEQVEEFMSEVLPAMDALEYVHRYSWFDGKITNSKLGPSALFDHESDLTAPLTEVGRYYSHHTPNPDIGPGVDTGVIEDDPNNLLSNPGFETGRMDPWGGFKNRINNGIDGIMAPYDGNYVGEIENGDGSMHQDVEVESGTTYSISYYSKWKTPVDRDIFATLRNVKEDGSGATFITDLPDVPFTTEWTQSTFEYTIPDSVNVLRVAFYKPNGLPPLYLDSFYMEVKP